MLVKLTPSVQRVHHVAADFSPQPPEPAEAVLGLCVSVLPWNPAAVGDVQGTVVGDLGLKVHLKERLGAGGHAQLL